MVGRKPKYSKKAIHCQLKLYSEDVIKCVSKKNCALWKILSVNLGGTISANGIYTYVKKNYNDCWKEIGYAKPIPHIEFVSDNESNYNEFNKSNEFSIHLNYDTWRNIQPKLTEGAKRSVSCLQPGWTHVIADALNNQTNFTCTWVFDKHFITEHGTHFLNIQAHCKECPGTLIMTAEDNAGVDEGITLNGGIEDVNEEYHTGKTKRPLSGKRRWEVAQQMERGMSAVIWRRKQAVALGMEVGDNERNTLYSLDVLRKCKQDQSEFNYLHKTPCPVKSLEILKYTQPYQGSIHGISMDKFYVHYWLPEQLAIYNNYCRSTPACTLAIDATGSVVEKLKRPYHNKSAYMFLYSAVIHLGTSHGQIPVLQMISEAHSINYIQLWLNEWIVAGALLPKIIVVDHSYALLGAVAKSFANVPDLKYYLNISFHCLFGSVVNLPNVFIRVDYAHVMKLISSWECLRKKARPLREFYIRALALLIKSVSVKQSEYIIESLLIVCNSEYNDTNTEDNRKISLKKMIATHDVVNIEADESCNVCEEQLNYTADENGHKITSWINTIVQRAASNICDEGNEENYHYLPSLQATLTKFLKTYVLWSCIMTPFYDTLQTTASSAIVESHFNDIKNRTFRHHNIPIRVDKFVSIHLNDIKGQLTLTIAQKNAQTSTKQLKCDDIQSSSESIDDENTVENWKNLAIGRKRKSYYASPCPEILTMTSGNKIKLALLRNGNSLVKPNNINKRQYLFSNTCAFDSFFQIIAATFCDSLSYKNAVCESDGKIGSMLTEFVKYGSLLKNIYRMRGELLQEIFQNKTRNSAGVICVSCGCHITFVIDKIMIDMPSTFLTKSCSSKTCKRPPRTRAVPVFPIAIDIIQINGIQALQHSIDAICETGTTTKQPCEHLHNIEKCSERTLETFNVGENIFLELDNTSCKLSEIPYTIIVFERTYYLRGVVHYIDSQIQDINALGHYVAFCRRLDATWEKFDDQQSQHKCVNNDLCVNVHSVKMK